MSILKHADFEPADWRQFPTPPAPWRAYADQVLALNPAAYWRLGDAAGQPAADRTDQHPGVYVGGVTHDEAGPLFRDADPAVRFNGTSGAMEVAGSTLLNGATACTILFWMKLHVGAITTDHGVISRASGGHPEGWQVWIDRDAFFSGRQRTLTFAFNAAGSDGRIEGTTDLITPGSPGPWECFALTFESEDSIRIYKDGQLDQEKATPITAFATTAEPLRLGRSASGFAHLPAFLDEVAVFDHALTASQIASLHGLGVGRVGLPQPGVVA